MDREGDPKEPPRIADRPLRYHTTHYERLFMLYVDLEVNGEKAKLSEVDSKSPVLSAASPTSWRISSESFLSAANEAGKKHGIGHVAKLRCGDLPMMEVEFAGTRDITEFLESLREGNFQKCLEMELRKQISPESGSLNLHVSLRLVVPLPDCHASSMEVTVGNLKFCLEILEEGNNFDYTNAMVKNGVPYCKKGIRFKAISIVESVPYLIGVMCAIRDMITAMILLLITCSVHTCSSQCQSTS